MIKTNFIYLLKIVFITCSFYSSFSSTAQIVELDWLKGMQTRWSHSINEVVSDANKNVFVIGYFTGRVDLDPGPGAQFFIPTVDSGDADVFIQKFDSTGQLLWIKTFGGEEYDAPVSADMDAQGNLFIAGAFGGTVDFDPGPGKVTHTSTNSASGYLLKLDNNGNLVWVKVFKGYTGGFTVGSLSIDANQIVIGGYFNGDFDFDPGPAVERRNQSNYMDAFVLKLDLSGNYQWVSVIETTGNQAIVTLLDHTVDSKGNIWAVGYFEGFADLDPGSGTQNETATGRDAYVLKLDGAGNYVWHAVYGGANDETPYTIEADGNDNIVFNVTAMLAQVDLNPGVGVDVPYKNSYPYLLSYTVKLDNQGNYLWAKTEGTGSAIDIEIDSKNNIYSVGQHRSGLDQFKLIGDTVTKAISRKPSAYVLKRSPMGDFLWAREVKDSALASSQGLHLLNDIEMVQFGHYLDTLNADFFNRKDSIPTGKERWYTNTFALKLSAFDCLEKPIIDSITTKCDTFVNAEPIVDSLKWLDCSNGYKVLPNDTLDTLFAQQGKTYALKIYREGCVDTTKCFKVVTPPANSSFQFSLFPNPNQGNFTIQLSNYDDPTIIYEVYSRTGTLSQRGIVNTFCKSKISINVAVYTKGVFSIKLIGEGTSVSKRFTMF